MTLLLTALLSAQLAVAGGEQLGEGDGSGGGGPSGVDADPPVGIINGEPADADLYPMTGAMLASYTLGGSPVKAPMCSSTLIAPDVVLLAAHCVDPIVLSQGFGDLPDLELRWSPTADLTAFGPSSAWPDESVAAGAWVTHPEWVYANLQVGLALNHDIGLMFLAEPVLDVTYANLPTPEEAVDVVVEGAEVVVVGWGMRNASDPGSGGRKEWGVSSIDALADYEFQVGKPTEAVRKCHGDSGGPSFLHLQDSLRHFRVVGVTSHAYDATTDCMETGGVDTRVDYYLDWIDSEMRAACEDGRRVYCDDPEVEGIPEPPPVVVWHDADELPIRLVGCAVTPSPGWLGLLGLVLLRRRR